eukprot:3165066-Pyramimonas_sp.AAC.1
MPQPRAAGPGRGPGAKPGGPQGAQVKRTLSGAYGTPAKWPTGRRVRKALLLLLRLLLARAGAPSCENVHVL